MGIQGDEWLAYSAYLVRNETQESYWDGTFLADVLSVKLAHLSYSSNAINFIFNGGSKERSVLFGGHTGLLGRLTCALNGIAVSIQFFTYSQIWHFLAYDPSLGYL